MIIIMNINPIKIEVSYFTLLKVNESLSCLDNNSVLNDRHVRVSRSVIAKLYKKLKTKEITKAGTSKKIKLTFEYYEAHYLETVLLLTNAVEYSHEVQTVINTLNQKLA